MAKQGPLYLQIANQIRKEIIDGKYPVGTMLPTEAQLEKMFNVSKITVRNAVEILSNEGFVSKKSGRGTTVISNQIYSRMKHEASFSVVLDEQETISRRVVSNTIVEGGSGDSFNGELGSNYTRFVKEVTLDGTPVVCFEYFFKGFEISKEEEQYVEEHSLYQFLAEKNYDIESVKEEYTIVPVAGNELLEKIFGTRADVVLKRNRKVFDSINQLVGVHVAYVDTSVYPYTVTFKL